MSRDYLVICERSGFKAWRSQCKMEWDNKLVLKRFWWRRNPLDFPPLIPTPTIITEPRPEGTDIFVTDNEVQASDL